MKHESDLSVIIKFDRRGFVSSVLLGATCEKDQLILDGGLKRLLKPNRFAWLKNLLKRR